MEEQKKQIDEQIGFVQLLKELTETQMTLAKIDAQLAIREGKKQVKDVIDATKNNLESQAKKFGANLKKIEEDYRNGNADKKGILEEYESSLTEINKTYETLMQDALERKSQLEADEQDIMLEQKQNKIETREARKEYARQEKTLKLEIMKATKEGDLETAQQKIEELQKLTENNPVNSLKVYNEELQTRRTEIRKLIEDVEKEYDQLMEDRKSEIDKVTEDKNNKLATIPKQNIFQKVLGSMFNKFNGTKKFMQSVMGPLQSKVATIKEENIPQIKQMISEKRQEFSKKIRDARVNIEEKVKGKVDKDVLTDKKDAIIQGIKDGKDAIVQGARNTKDTAKTKIGQAKGSVVTHVTSAVDNGKRTFRNVIGKGYEAKMNFIQKAQDRLNEKQAEIAQKMKVLNPDKTVQDQGMEIEG